MTTFEDDLRDRYLLTLCYMADLAYYSQVTILRRLNELGALSSTIYNTGGTLCFVVEFETSVVVSFSGSLGSQKKNNQTIMNFNLVDFFNAKCHSGFVAALNRVAPKVSKDLVKFSHKKIIYTGHAIGGSLAQLMCFYNRPDEVCTFGSYKSGGGVEFRRAFGTVNMSRVVNTTDFLVYFPFKIPILAPYEHVGDVVYLPTKLVFDDIEYGHKISSYRKSILLKDKVSRSLSVHNIVREVEK